MSNSRRRRRADARETDDAVGRHVGEQGRDDGGHAGALDHDVGCERCEIVKFAAVIGAAERAHEVRLRPARVVIVDMHLVAALRAEQRAEQADRSRAGDEQLARWRAFEPPHAVAMVPRLGDDARRLQQHAQNAERGIDLDGELRRDAPALRAEAVPRLDAVLGVEPVAAHVPFAVGAGRAGDRIGLAHDADDMIARREAAIRRRFAHAAERLVAEDQPRVTLGRFAVMAGDDLVIGAADAERNRFDQQRAVSARRFGNVGQRGGIRNSGKDRDGAQRFGPIVSPAT